MSLRARAKAASLEGVAVWVEHRDKGLWEFEMRLARLT